MKTQLLCIAFIAFMSLTTSSHLNRNTLVYDDDFTLKEFKIVVGMLFKPKQNILINKIDFTEASGFPKTGYWDMIDLIDSIVNKNVPSINLIFSEAFVDKLGTAKKNVLAELVIASRHLPRIKPNFDLEKIKDSNRANNGIEEFEDMHNKVFKNKLTVELTNSIYDSYVLESYADFDETFIFVKTSNLMYDYIFAGVDFSKITRIKLFHLALYDYFKSKDFPSIESIHFDVGYFWGNDFEWTYDVKVYEYVDALIGKSKDRTLIIRYDDNSEDYMNLDAAKPKIKKAFGKRVKWHKIRELRTTD